MNDIAFYGKSGETTGSVGERIGDSSKNETTGSVGYYSFGEEGTPNISRSLPRDSVTFNGYSEYNNTRKSSSAGVVFGVASLAALTIVGCGYAQKTGAVNKIKSDNVKKIVTSVAEPCYKLCSKIKASGLDCYKKIFKK